MESLQALRPAFRGGGSVTTGNSSGVNDCAAALVLMRASTARELGLKCLATLEYVGGAIALGHPLGAAGAFLTLRAAKDLHRRGLEYGVVTLCIGGGQALAALIRRHEA